jgi:hypothetical protein
MASSLSAQQLLPSNAHRSSEFVRGRTVRRRPRCPPITSAATLTGSRRARDSHGLETPAAIARTRPRLRAFAGRVGNLDALSNHDLILERRPNILLPFCYTTRKRRTIWSDTRPTIRKNFLDKSVLDGVKDHGLRISSACLKKLAGALRRKASIRVSPPSCPR